MNSAAQLFFTNCLQYDHLKVRSGSMRGRLSWLDPDSKLRTSGEGGLGVGGGWRSNARRMRRGDFGGEKRYRPTDLNLLLTGNYTNYVVNEFDFSLPRIPASRRRKNLESCGLTAPHGSCRELALFLFRDYRTGVSRPRVLRFQSDCGPSLSHGIRPRRPSEAESSNRGLSRLRC